MQTHGGNEGLLHDNLEKADVNVYDNRTPRSAKEKCRVDVGGFAALDEVETQRIGS